MPHIQELDGGNIYRKSQLTWGCQPMSLSLHVNPPLEFQSCLHNIPVISHHVLSPYANEIQPFYSDNSVTMLMVPSHVFLKTPFLRLPVFMVNYPYLPACSHHFSSFHKFPLRFCISMSHVEDFCLNVNEISDRGFGQWTRLGKLLPFSALLWIS